MVCPSSEELSALYDQRLSLKRARELREHLAFCPRCANEIEVTRQVINSLPNTPAPPSGLAEKAIAVTCKKNEVFKDSIKIQSSHPTDYHQQTRK